MTNISLLKQELKILEESIVKYTKDNRDNMSAKSRLIHDLKDIGFVKISTTKWAFDIRNDGTSYVSFIIIFRGRAVDITEDHIIIQDGKESPTSTFKKPFTLMSVRYGKVSLELLDRVKTLSLFFKGEILDV